MFRALFLIALMGLGGCTSKQIAVACQQDALLQPVAIVTVTVTGVAVGVTNPPAGAAVETAVAVDKTLVHPIVVADCAAVAASDAPVP